MRNTLHISASARLPLALFLFALALGAQTPGKPVYASTPNLNCGLRLIAPMQVQMWCYTNRDVDCQLDATTKLVTCAYVGPLYAWKLIQNQVMSTSFGNAFMPNAIHGPDSVMWLVSNFPPNATLQYQVTVNGANYSQGILSVIDMPNKPLLAQNCQWVHVPGQSPIPWIQDAVIGQACP